MWMLFVLYVAIHFVQISISLGLHVPWHVGGCILRIKRINKVPNVDVYNMEVEDVHCFAVSKSNIIVHNCDAMRYGLMYLKDKNDISGAALNVGV